MSLSEQKARMSDKIALPLKLQDAKIVKTLAPSALALLVISTGGVIALIENGQDPEAR